MFQMYDPFSRIQAFAVSRQGSSHRRARPPKPCQDSSGVLSGSFRGDHFLFAAVSDGHGGAPHPMSEVGAQFAIRAAGEEFQNCAVRFGDMPGPTMAGEFKNTYPANVFRAWSRLVTEHARLSQKDATGLVPDQVHKLYGATLLMAAMYREYLFLAQIGDGEVVVFLRNGRVERPFVEYPEMVGGETHSLCSANALKHFRMWTMGIHEMDSVLLCSDGVRNSYDSDSSFLNLMAATAKNVRQFGVGPSTDIIPETLDFFSKNASGDDMTLAGLVFFQDPCALEHNTEGGTEPPLEPEETVAGSDIPETVTEVPEVERKEGVVEEVEVLEVEAVEERINALLPLELRRDYCKFTMNRIPS